MGYLEAQGLLHINFTQNIDSLELKAKVSNEKMIFAHGNLNEAHCASCDAGVDLNLQKEYISKNEVLYCDLCKGPCKPKVVLYGENLPQQFYDNIDKLKECDVAFIMGTSLRVYPFSLLPNELNPNAHRVLVNMEKVGSDLTGAKPNIFNFDNLSSNDIFLEGKTDEIILKFLQDIGQEDEFDKFIKESMIKEI